MPDALPPPVKEWLTKNQVAELTGLKAVTIVSYASRGKWRRQVGPDRRVLFWHEDALRHGRKNMVWHNRFGHSAEIDERLRYRVTKVLDNHGVPVPVGVSVKVQVLEPVLPAGADPIRTPGAVRHIIFTKD